MITPTSRRSIAAWAWVRMACWSVARPVVISRSTSRVETTSAAVAVTTWEITISGSLMAVTKATGSETVYCTARSSSIRLVSPVISRRRAGSTRRTSPMATRSSASIGQGRR